MLDFGCTVRLLSATRLQGSLQGAIPIKKRTLILAVLSAALIAMSVPSAAEALYQWVDEKGEVHITDDPPLGRTVPEPAADPLPEKPPASPPPAPVVPPRSSGSSVQMMPGTPVTAVPAAAPAVQAPTTTLPASLPAGTVPPATAPTATAAPSDAPQRAAAPERPHTVRHEPAPNDVMAFIAAFLLVIIVIGVLFYLYFSFCLYRIAQKTNFENAWAAWVPILQLWPFVGAAGKPIWWVLLLCIPLAGFVIGTYLWMRICENLGKSKWLGLLVLVPIANIVLPGYLALSRSE